MYLLVSGLYNKERGMIEKKYKVTQRLKSRYLIVTARGFEPLTLRAEI